METIFTALFASLSTIAFDWVFMVRLAAYYPDFDYRHWPMTVSRRVTLLAMVSLAAWTAAWGSGAPFWTILPVLAILGCWGYFGVSEINRQRATGYRHPPRYSE
jgi:hypothetical protein